MNTITAQSSFARLFSLVLPASAPLAFVAILGAHALGCAAGPAEATDPQAASASAAPRDGEATSQSTEALKGGGGGGLGFSCSILGCICNGDFDCNNMFGSGVCDGRRSQCWERGPGPVYCTCYPTAGKAAGSAAGSGAHASGGTLTTK